MPDTATSVDLYFKGDADPVVLEDTLGNLEAVNALGRGLGDVLSRIATGDFSVYVAVIAVATDKRKPSQVQKIKEKVRATGLGPLSDPLSRYVQMLMSGGVDPAEVGAAKDGDDAGK